MHKLLMKNNKSDAACWIVELTHHTIHRLLSQPPTHYWGKLL